MQNLNEIIKKLKNILPVLKQDFKVAEIGIFGSYARGEQKASSDIDILVEFKGNGIGLFKFMDME